MDAKAPTLPSSAAALHGARLAATPRWSRSITTLDWLAIVPAIALSVATLVAMSEPIVDPNDGFPIIQVWPFVAILWAYSVYHFLENDDAVRAGRLLLWAAFASFLGILPLAILTYTGMLGVAVAIAGIAVLLGLVIVHERPARLAWLIVTAISMGALALILADAPANLRLRLNEPTLTAYAQSVARGDTPTLAYGDPAIEIGSLRFDRINTFAGCVRFGMTTVDVGANLDTGYSGYEPAGIAYCPDGPPPEGGRRPARYEPMIPAWYRWLPVAPAPAP